jgi:hypothetical protein
MNVHARTNKFINRLSYRYARRRERAAAQPERPRVVFIHTPKTGGTSINQYFKEYIGSKRSGRFVQYDHDPSMALDVFEVCAGPAKFVTGHMPWTAFERCRDENAFCFTILRDPYDRLRSLYRYIVNLPPSVKRADEINEMQLMSLREFLSSRDRRVRFHTDNYLARQFSGPLEVLAETPAERLLLAEKAIHNLSSLDFVGFNDDVDRAFAEATRVAGLPPVAGHRLNTTADLIPDAEKRAEAARPFDDEMRALAAPLVEADMVVYEHFRDLRARAAKAVEGLRALGPVISHFTFGLVVLLLYSPVLQDLV